MEEKKPWYASKTKLGAVLVGLGPVLITVGGMISGSLDLGPGLVDLATELGIVLAVFGIRDWPLLNKLK